MSTKTTWTAVSAFGAALLLAACSSSGGGGGGNNDTTSSPGDGTNANNSAVLDAAFVAKVNATCQKGLGTNTPDDTITVLIALPEPQSGKVTWTTIVGELKDLQTAGKDVNARASAINRLDNGLFNTRLIDGPCGQLFK
jgi:hypothetical protein